MFVGRMNAIRICLNEYTIACYFDCCYHIYRLSSEIAFAGACIHYTTVAVGVCVSTEKSRAENCTHTKCFLYRRLSLNFYTFRFPLQSFRLFVCFSRFVLFVHSFRNRCNRFFWCFKCEIVVERRISLFSY